MSVGGYADLLRGMKAYALPTKIRNVSLLPADETLMALDITAAGNGDADPMALADFLTKNRSKYDWCLIDCPPAFSAGAAAALVAADEVVIPLKLDAFGVRGLANLIEQINNMRRLNADLEIAGVLPTLCYRTEQQRKAVEDLRLSLAKIGIRMFHPIRRSQKIDEMTFAQTPIIDFSPRSAPAKDYRKFVRDLMREGGED